MKHFGYKYALVLLITFFVALPCGAQVVGTKIDLPGDPQQQEPTYPQVEAFDQITLYQNGIVEFLWTVPDPSKLLDGNIVPRNAQQAAQLFLLQNRDVMGINNLNDYQIASVEPGGNGRSDVIFEQSHNGFPILTTKLVLTVENRLVIYVMGRIVCDTSILYDGPVMDPGTLLEKINYYGSRDDGDPVPIIKVVYFPTPQKIHMSFELIEEVINGNVETFLNGESLGMEPLEQYTTYYNR